MTIITSYYTVPIKIFLLFIYNEDNYNSAI